MGADVWLLHAINKVTLSLSQMPLREAQPNKFDSNPSQPHSRCRHFGRDESAGDVDGKLGAMQGVVVLVTGEQRGLQR